MIKEVLQTGRAALSINIQFAAICFLMFGLNHLSAVQAQNKDIKFAAKIEQTMEEAAENVSIGRYKLAREKYSEIINAYPNTEFALEALGEIASLHAMQWDDQAVDALIDKLEEQYSNHTKVTRVVDRIAQSYIRNDNIFKAQHLYENAVKIFHDHPDIAWLYGTLISCKIENQDFINAQQSIKEFKKNYSTYVDLCAVINTLADACKGMKEYNLAKNLYQYVYQNSSDESLTIQGLTGEGLCEIRLKNQTEANRIFEKLKSMHSKYEDLCQNLCKFANEYHYVNDPLNSKSICEYILQRYPDHNSAVMIQRDLAQSEIRLGNITAAEEAINKLMSDYLEYEGFWEQLLYAGFEYVWKGHFEKGQALWRYIAEKSPDKAIAIKAQSQIINAELRQGSNKDVENEINTIKNMLKKFGPGNDNLYLELLLTGNELYRNKEYERAKDIYMFMSKQSSDPLVEIKAKGKIVNCEFALGRNSIVGDLVEDLKRNYSDNFALYQVLSDIADKYYLMKNYNKAENLYSYVSEQSPDKKLAIRDKIRNIVCQTMSGKEIQIAKEFDKVKKYFDESPGFYQSIYSYANNFQKLGDHGKARELYQYVLRSKPNKSIAFGSQIGIVFCDFELGNEYLVDQGIYAIKNNFTDYKDAFAKLLVFAERFQQKQKYDKAIDIYQYVCQKSSDSDEVIKALTGIGRCQIRLNNTGKAALIIEQLKKDFSNNKELCSSLHALANEFWRTRKLDRASRLCQYIIQAFPDNDLAVKATRFVAGREIRSKKIKEAEAIIKKFMRDYSDHKEFFNVLSGIALELSWNGFPKKSKEQYQYVAKNCPDRKIAFNAQKQVLNMDMIIKNQKEFVQDIEVLIDDFSDHPKFHEYLDNVSHTFLNRIKFIPWQKLDKQATQRFYKLIIRKYPEMSFALAAKCQSVKLDCNYNSESVDENFKEFLADNSRKPEYFKYLDHILSRDGSFKQNYRKYVIDSIKKQIESSKELDEISNLLEILMKHTIYRRYSKELDTFAVSCANKGQPDLFVKMVDRLRETKEKKRALELCKLFIQSNPKNLSSQVMLLKAYNIKYEDGQAGNEMIKQLDEYIKDNSQTNKQLACQAMLLKGRVLIKMGEIEQVRKVYETYKKEASNSKNMPEVLYYIGYACLIQGDFEQAKSSFSRILADYSNSEYAAKARQYIHRINSSLGG